MATISKTGIQDGLTSKAEHLTRIIDALDGTATTEVVATGSFTGSFIGDGSSLSGVSSTNQINLHFNTVGALGTLSPSSNYFFGNDRVVSTDSASVNSQYIPFTGTITRITVRNILGGVSSDPHSAPVQFYNFTTNTSSSIGQSLGHSGPLNLATNSASISVTAGDRVMIKIETPAFGSNPTNVYYFADVLVQGT